MQTQLKNRKDIFLDCIVVGIENPPFLAKSHIFIPRCTAGGGSNGLGTIPKNIIFDSFPKGILR